jgi:hypothetical protein
MEARIILAWVASSGTGSSYSILKPMSSLAST